MCVYVRAFRTADRRTTAIKCQRCVMRIITTGWLRGCGLLCAPCSINVLSACVLLKLLLVTSSSSTLRHPIDVTTVASRTRVLNSKPSSVRIILLYVLYSFGKHYIKGHCTRALIHKILVLTNKITNPCTNPCTKLNSSVFLVVNHTLKSSCTHA